MPGSGLPDHDQEALALPSGTLRAPVEEGGRDREEAVVTALTGRPVTKRSQTSAVQRSSQVWMSSP